MKISNSKLLKYISFDKRVVYFCVCIIAISILCCALPVITVRTYSVYMYNLERTQIATNNISIFQIVLGNSMFNKKPIIAGLFALPVIEIILLLIYSKNRSPYLLIISMVLGVFTIISFSFFNTLYAKVLGGKVYCFQKDFLKFSKPFTPITPIDKSHDISFWIDLGYGSFIVIALNAISVSVLFIQSVFTSKVNKNVPIK